MFKRSGRVLLLGFLMALTLFVLISLIGCGEPDSPTVEPDSPATVEGEVIVEQWDIPQITILTGPAASFGLDASWGVERAVKEINDAGGIRGKPVKLTQYDTEYDTSVARTVMTRVLGNNPLAIIGPMDQTGADASGDLVVSEGVPWITSLADPEVRAKYYPWGASSYPDSGNGSAFGAREWLRLNPDIESVVILYIPYEPAHVMQAERQEEIFAELGIEVLGKIEGEFGQLDWGPQAVKALALKADGYYSNLNVMEHPLFVKALHDRGMTDGSRICAGMGATGGMLFEIGEGYLEDTYLWDFYDFNSTDPDWLEYIAAYEEDRDGLFPYSAAIHGNYEAMYVIKEAIESLEITGDPTKLAEEREMIRDFIMNAKNLNSPTGGTYNYLDGEKVVEKLFMYQIRNNKLVLISTFIPEY